jgi:4-alpha-glucanotransferase
MADRHLVARALTLLGKHRLVLAIHDPSFPSDDDEDIGQGASTTRGAERLLAFAADLGFTGIQLGPQGATSAMNPSPYDGTVLSRSPLTISAARLVDEGLVQPATLARRARPGTDRADPARAHDAMRALLDEAYGNRAPLADELAAYRARHVAWLERDALYDPLCRLHHAGSWREWTADVDRDLWARDDDQTRARRAELLQRFAGDVDRYAFAQLLAERHHAALRGTCARLGLLLYGDLQIGLSVVDVWTQAAVVLPKWRMGAPPSRTNPEGQPWGYAVLDPRKAAAALDFVARRMDRMLASYDGVRIDHPHGHCDPWVYDGDAPDALRAVQTGGRLYGSPERADLAAYAIARADQIDATQKPYEDHRVRALDDEQVAAYAAVIDVVVEAARKNGRRIDDLLCEVLSTLPYPLERVMQRHGLGRFRVTQKASLTNPDDVYRAENARPEDWIMIGNHDTKPMPLVVDEWERAGTLDARRALLARNLRVDAATLRGKEDVAQAMLAEVFASPAANAMVFFADLFGATTIYNRPGVVSDDNWRLRLTSSFPRAYADALREGRALHVGKALAAALRARGVGADEARALEQG